MRSFYVTFETWDYSVNNGVHTRLDYTYVTIQENEKACVSTFIEMLKDQGYTVDMIIAWSLVEE